MAEAEVIIVLRTFSGPNLGAEVMLPPGTYTIGTDYSCDVVLSDSGMAPRHAALTAESPQPGAPPRVHVKPLDADVMLEDGSVPAGGAEIPLATPWYLGLTCLSWNTPRAPREAIIPRLPGQPRQASGQADPAPPAGVGAPGGTKSASGSNVVGENPETPLSWRKRWPVRVAALLLLAALSALIFEFRTTPASTEELAIKLREEIRLAGFGSVVVSGENDRITVSGTVLDERERARIWSMARNLNYPVYIRVGVREDLAQAVKMKLNAGGVFPEVSFPGDGDSLRVAAYIKDLQTENAAFASLAADLPNLPQIERRIVHGVQLKSFIEQGLDRARLRDINITLGPGRVELADPSPSGNHEALERVMARIEENLNIPLAYTIISRDSPSGAEPRAADVLVSGGISPDMPVITSGSSPLGGLRITGVTMGPMRFITLGNGQRIFEGGMLPGGHVLESIHLDTLTLSKNGRATTYPLRGDNE